MLEKTPPELAGDIFEQGLLLTGGGSMLRGLDVYLAKALKVGARVADDPINCVAIGTGKSIGMLGQLESGFKDATPGIGKR